LSNNEENVSIARFQDFKDEVLRAISDLGGRVCELSGEIRAYNTTVQSQSNQLVQHDTEIKELKKDIEKVVIKVDQHSNDIVEIKTIMKNNKDQTNRMITIVGFVLLLIEFAFKYLVK
jgi:formyltetrahydrofolate synthetase